MIFVFLTIPKTEYEFKTNISENHLKQMNTEAFTGYENVGNVLFAHSNHAKKSLN